MVNHWHNDAYEILNNGIDQTGEKNASTVMYQILFQVAAST